MRLFRKSSTRDVRAADLPTILTEGATVIDVRTPHEWAAGHLPFAKHIPLDELLGRVGELDRDALNVFICHVGARSQAAADALARHGFTTATVPGGMESALVAKLPVVRNDGAPGRVIGA